MNWSASVLTTLSSDTEPTIVITFDTAKYVFNTGENTGRAWLQSRRHWKSTKGIFLTSLGTQRASGLPGLLMFFADSNISKVDVLGPCGLSHFIASMRSYLWRDTISVNPVDVDTEALIATTDPSPVYKDENISMYAIPLTPGVNCDVHPRISSEVPDVSDNGSLKRKRSISPPSASKRLQQDQSLPEPSEVSNGTGSPRSLRERAKLKDFSPPDLRDADAREWRRLVIENMFPFSPPAVVQKQAPQMSKKAKKKAEKALGEEKPVPSPEASTLTAVPNDSMGRKVHTIPRENQAYGSGKHPSILLHRDRPLPPLTLPHGSTSPFPESKQTLCYVVVGPAFRGKFDAKRADALGLPFGPLRGQVANGKPVTFLIDDGEGGKVERTVKPEDCVAPPDPQQVVIILDVPSPSHIPSLTTSFESNPFYASLMSTQLDSAHPHPRSVHAVFHICGNGVLEDERYKMFMKQFPEKLHHVVASHEHLPDPVTFTSAAFNQFRLNHLDADLFPVLGYRTKSSKDLSSVAGLPPNIVPMAANTIVDIRPAKPPVLDKSAEESDLFHPMIAGIKPFSLGPQTQNEFSSAKEAVSTMIASDPEPGDDVVVLPLGTSSAHPTKYRNVSSTLIRIPNHGSILLDAGEGTFSQLARFYGSDPEHGVTSVLRDLKCIFLSHAHGDHHIGVAKLLAMRQQLVPMPDHPLYVIGVRSHLLYLQDVSCIEDLGLRNPDGNGVKLILSDALNWRNARDYGSQPWLRHEEFMNSQRSRDLAKEMCQSLGLEEFLSVDVYHRTRAYGAVIKHTDGWSIVFSGDTMPTNNLVRAGQNATLLIHEATMGDDEVELAEAKAHSTIGQAISIGKKMNAKNVLLTHFSARYPKMPPDELGGSLSLGSGSSRNPTIAVAFDHCHVKIGDMKKLKTYLPAIRQSFLDTAEEGDEDTHSL